MLAAGIAPTFRKSAHSEVQYLDQPSILPSYHPSFLLFVRSSFSHRAPYWHPRSESQKGPHSKDVFRKKKI